MASDTPNPQGDTEYNWLAIVLAKQLLLENLVCILIKDKMRAEKLNVDDVTAWAEAIKTHLSQRIAERTPDALAASASGARELLLKDVDAFFHQVIVGISN